MLDRKYILFQYQSHRSYNASLDLVDPYVHQIWNYSQMFWYSLNLFIIIFMSQEIFPQEWRMANLYFVYWVSICHFVCVCVCVCVCGKFSDENKMSFCDDNIMIDSFKIIWTQFQITNLSDKYLLSHFWKPSVLHGVRQKCSQDDRYCTQDMLTNKNTHSNWRKTP